MTTTRIVHEVTCYCGTPMALSPTPWGYHYRCTRGGCEGTHSAHKDGRPMGTPADKATRALRMQVHARLDPLWRSQPGRARQCDVRKAAYRRLAADLGMAQDACHIGAFDADLCRLALKIMAAWDVTP